MFEDRRDVLQVLRYELNFLEQGGYRRSSQTQLRNSPFQDTLSCLNFGEPLRPHACHECALYDLVPEDSKTQDVPCHFIPLDEDGTTLAKLLESGDDRTWEAKLQNWLRKTVAKLEQDRGAPAPADG